MEEGEATGRTTALFFHCALIIIISYYNNDDGKPVSRKKSHELRKSTLWGTLAMYGVAAAAGSGSPPRAQAVTSGRRLAVSRYGRK